MSLQSIPEPGLDSAGAVAKTTIFLLMGDRPPFEPDRSLYDSARELVVASLEFALRHIPGFAQKILEGSPDALHESIPLTAAAAGKLAELHHMAPERDIARKVCNLCTPESADTFAMRWYYWKGTTGE